MLLTCGGAHEIARPHVALLRADAEPAGAGQDVVELVADRVAMSGLLLPGLEAVRVAEEARGIDEADLLHLLGGELEPVGDPDEVIHGGCVARGGGGRKYDALR